MKDLGGVQTAATVQAPPPGLASAGTGLSPDHKLHFLPSQEASPQAHRGPQLPTLPQTLTAFLLCPLKGRGWVQRAEWLLGWKVLGVLGARPQAPWPYLVQETQLLPRLCIQNLHLKKENSLFRFLGCLGGSRPGEAVKARAQPLAGLPGHQAQADIHTARHRPGRSALPTQAAAPAAGRQPPPQTSPKRSSSGPGGRDQILPRCWKRARACPGTAGLCARCNSSGTRATAQLNIKLPGLSPPRSHATVLLGGGPGAAPGSQVALRRLSSGHRPPSSTRAGRSPEAGRHLTAPPLPERGRGLWPLARGGGRPAQAPAPSSGVSSSLHLETPQLF